jgi:hypothetical protein
MIKSQDMFLAFLWALILKGVFTNNKKPSKGWVLTA